jgi:hypothetical protein
MKKIAFILGTAFLFFTATVNAQTDTTLPKEPAKVQTENTMPKENVTATTTTSTTSTDKWNNYSPDKYKMLPMPEALTTEKIFPVIGHYSVTSKDAATTDATSTSTATSSITITLDESNKGIAWIDGLPQGKIKAYLRKSPAVYKIPAQKTADDKELSEGVLIFNKDANTLDVCIGCTYNNDDPAAAFTATEQPVVEEQPAVTKSKKGTAKAKAKVIPVKTWKYSGSKTSESTASIAPMQQ